jgi:carbonic anhydrase
VAGDGPDLGGRRAGGSGAPRRRLLAAGVAAAVGGLASMTAGAPAGAAGGVATGPADGDQASRPLPARSAAALARLLAGNRRFVQGRARHPHQSPRDRRALANGQYPFAVTLGCADSRVPPELLFDEGLGDLFDNRVAGNVVDDLLLGSIEYAVEHFDPALVVVLGHERCGAVTATVEAIERGGPVPGYVGAVVAALRPAVEAALRLPGDPVENGVRINVRYQAAALVRRSRPIREAVAAGRLAVVGARYDLDTGAVTVVR